MTITQNTTQSTIDTYFAMWNEPDRSKRLDVIAQAWTPDCRYVDPLSDVTGYEGLADMVEGVRSQYPGAKLELTGDVDAHHDVVRFPWRAFAEDGTDIVAGIDVAVIAEDGRFRSLAGFFG